MEVKTTCKHNFAYLNKLKLLIIEMAKLPVNIP